MSGLAVEKLTKVYPGGVEALRGIDLRVEPGEMVAVVGPSGCGKTTLLRLVAGLERATAGTVRIGGDVAMVFQEDALYPHLSVRGNLELRGRLRRSDRRALEERVRLAADLLKIGPLLERLPATLSGGERRRVALGRAVAAEAPIVLLDEPLSGLDAPLRSELRVELKALQRHLGWTALYVTHDQAEALALGDRVCVMDAGLVHQVGTPADVYDRPADRFVAGFIGDPPMNFLEGTLGRGPQGLAFCDAGGLRLAVTSATAREGPAVLGFRPGSLRPVTHTEAGAIAVRISAAEIIGAQVDVIGLTSAGARIAARLERGGAWEPGQTVLFKIDPRALLLFEPGPAGLNLG